ncbi:MAG TPA: chromate transporter [Xanthobacteraceae bacterium]|jgi:chromate transporter
MSESTTIPARASKVAPRPLALFIAFSLISVSGFGGVLYWSRRMMVDERGWMTAEEFNEAYALCNFLPGPNIVNFSVVFGRQVAGTVGALVALLGLLGPPFVLVTLLGLLYAHYGEIAALQRVLAGVAAAAAGLTISTGIKMAGPLFGQRPGFAHAVAIAAFLSVGVLRWPIYWVLGALIPCGIAMAWWTRR